jgi:hypothetical protein
MAFAAPTLPVNRVAGASGSVLPRSDKAAYNDSGTARPSSGTNTISLGGISALLP